MGRRCTSWFSRYELWLHRVGRHLGISAGHVRPFDLELGAWRPLPIMCYCLPVSWGCCEQTRCQPPLFADQSSNHLPSQGWVVCLSCLEVVPSATSPVILLKNFVFLVTAEPQKNALLSLVRCLSFKNWRGALYGHRLHKRMFHWCSLEVCL